MDSCGLRVNSVNRATTVYGAPRARGANMWVIILEAVIALTLLLVIVLATLPRRRKDKQQDKENNE